MCTELLPPGGYAIAVNKYIISYTKVKEVKLFHLHAMKTRRGSRGIDPLVLNLGTKRMFWEVNFKTQTT